MASSGRNPNPWFTDDDDERGFGGQKAVGGSQRGGYPQGKDPFLDDEDDFSSAALSPYDELQQQKQASMARQMDGANRALSSIYESERMGIATAEELVHQGEQLDNTEKKLDTINTDLKTSQRHLNSVKSMFGGIKNWWKGTPKDEASSSQPERRRPETSLQSSMGASSSEMPSARTDHPGLRNTKGFYDDSTDGQQQKQMSDDRRQYEEQLDSNLDAMSAGLARLKGLGMGLGEEISVQNDQIERISNKADRSDILIKDQNRQMRKVLGK